jgi:hypothetical protein
MFVPGFLESPPILLEARFRNEGTVHEAPSGEIEVRNMFGWLVATSTLPVRNVLPGDVRKVEASVGDGLWLGRYTVSLSARYGDGNEELKVTAKFLSPTSSVCDRICVRPVKSPKPDCASALQRERRESSLAELRATLSPVQFASKS